MLKSRYESKLPILNSTPLDFDQKESEGAEFKTARSIGSVDSLGLGINNALDSHQLGFARPPTSLQQEQMAKQALEEKEREDERISRAIEEKEIAMKINGEYWSNVGGLEELDKEREKRKSRASSRAQSRAQSRGGDIEGKGERTENVDIGVDGSIISSSEASTFITEIHTRPQTKAQILWERSRKALKQRSGGEDKDNRNSIDSSVPKDSSKNNDSASEVSDKYLRHYDKHIKNLTSNRAISGIGESDDAVVDDDSEEDIVPPEIRMSKWMKETQVCLFLSTSCSTSAFVVVFIVFSTHSCT